MTQLRRCECNRTALVQLAQHHQILAKLHQHPGREKTTRHDVVNVRSRITAQLALVRQVRVSPSAHPCLMLPSACRLASSLPGRIVLAGTLGRQPQPKLPGVLEQVGMTLSKVRVVRAGLRHAGNAAVFLTLAIAAWHKCFLARLASQRCGGMGSVVARARAVHVRLSLRLPSWRNKCLLASWAGCINPFISGLPLRRTGVITKAFGGRPKAALPLGRGGCQRLAAVFAGF